MRQGVFLQVLLTLLTVLPVLPTYNMTTLTVGMDRLEFVNR